MIKPAVIVFEVEAPSFMEGKRQQNVGMKLGALKLKSARDFERMRSWVLKLNTTVTYTLFLVNITLS